MSNLVCEDCKKSDDTVEERFCVYHLEINDEEVSEIICDACEYEHMMDI